MMTSPKGVPLLDRWSTVGNAQRGCLRGIRRFRREWIDKYEDEGFDIDRLFLDPLVDWSDRPTHVDHTKGYLRLERENGAGELDFKRAADGRWLGTSPGRMRDFMRRYQEGEVGQVETADEDDLFLIGALG